MSVLDLPGDSDTLEYILTHVFCPPQLPGRNDHSALNHCSLAQVVATTGRLFSNHVSRSNANQWHSISRMLENLHATFQSECLNKSQTISQLNGMAIGDTLAFFIRAQNAGVVFRKQKDVIIFEAFEVSPKAENVMATEGKLICSYPGPAIEIPNSVICDDDFLCELVNFLVHMNEDDLDTTGTEAPNLGDTVHPHYITELLTGILRSIGRPANISRINKRVGDDVLCSDDSVSGPWRRSSLWLLIRVVLQTTLDRSRLGHHTYKEFMLFFMCCLAKEQPCADFPSGLLHFMSSKISRRLRKLGSSAPDWLAQTVLGACASLGLTIDTRWRQVQAALRVSPLCAPSQLDLAQDIQPSLSNSRDYLCNALANRGTNSPEVPFNPGHLPRGSLDDFLSSDGFFENVYRIEPHVALYDVEKAVERNIDAWVGRVRRNGKACVKLETLAAKYSSSALKTYANNPELLSVMLLTTVELWVALDKIAIKEIPMLADYSPEVPTSLLESLLLCGASNLDRLRRAHRYVSRRHSQSRDHWSTFSSTITVDSFAVRFYKKSWHLQRLKTRIEGVAQRQVRKKIAELEEKTRKTILPKYDESIWRIEVHRWPLPSNELEAAVVIFELDCPISFNMWRTATFHLLVDLCSAPTVQQTQHVYTQLNCYQPLQPHFVGHPRSRITLGLDVPPQIQCTAIPASLDQVCIKKDWTFSVFDTQTGIPLSRALGFADSSGNCTYKLPSGRYSSLQKYVTSVSSTSNEVVAHQADCHKDLPILEYIAFGHLRSGGLLQWLNILRELRSQSLRFRRPEVHMLLAQAVSQVGPLEDTGWVWHQEIQRPTFCSALLRELQILVQNVEANWLEAVTMDTVSFLLRRLLASGPDDAISLEVLCLLRIVRGKVFAWIRELLPVLMKTPGDNETRDVLRDIAAICRGTFDNADPTKSSKSLHSADDMDILLTSAIIINLHTPGDLSCLPAYSQLLLDRDRRLSLALESDVSDFIQTDSGSRGVNLAVKRIWPDYCPGSKWCFSRVQHSPWFSCMTAPPQGQHPQEVYLNILNGSLLVDGKSFGTWLPNEFVRHPLYNLIFGEQVLEVIPSDLPGMGYSTCNLIFGHQVYISLRNRGSDLVIRAKRKLPDTGDSDVIELIPHKKLEGDLPAMLVQGHAHWLNLSTCTMEIRPLDNLWETSAENWRINCTPGHYRVWKGHDFLVDIRSNSWGMVSSLLRPLSAPQDLIVSVSLVGVGNPASQLQLSVVLPRYDLSFYIDEDGELQSRDIRGMVYDENQSIGTLFGLVNQLVLRPKTTEITPVELVPRCVIIPDSVVSFRMGGYHVRVEITPSRSCLERVVYQTYSVDTDLGCLTGNGSLTSRLYCAYLHALTSGCGNDPLTGRSGTEEALSLLRSAACWSAGKISSRDVELLGLIASIWSSRIWYHEPIVQKVECCNLPANSQNHELYLVSKAIKEHYEMMQSFHENQSHPPFQNFPPHNDHLLRRSAHRVSSLFPSWPSGQSLAADFDARYPARDLVDCAPGEHRAYTAAMYVHHRAMTTTKDIWEMVRSWEKVYGDTVLSFQYDRSWLSPDLQLTWLKTYNLLRDGGERQWFQLLFSLPAMAYASEKLSDLVPVFVAFASHSLFRLEDPPHYNSYPILEGCFPNLATLKNYVVSCTYPFKQTPEGLKLAKYRRSPGDVGQRQLEKYYERRDSDAVTTAERLLDAWPCEVPPPCSLDPKLYDVEDLSHKVQRHFSGCFRNSKLREHLARVQVILNNLHSPTPDTPQYSFCPAERTPHIRQSLVLDPFSGKSPPSFRTHNRLPRFVPGLGDPLLADAAPLHQLISTVGANAVNPFQLQYVSALRTSAECFGKKNTPVVPGTSGFPAAQVLAGHYAQCRADYIEALHHLQLHLAPESQSERAAELSGQWPRITAYTLFCCLASNSPVSLSDDWKKCLIRLILLALELQRARRLLLLRLDGLHEEFCKELQNEGCDGWSAESNPDWLLIQLQSNFLIRRVQAEVANEMISPRSGENTVMQLNMGEGKTSVIVPIVAAVLANGDQLVRVIVPKPLIAQTLHLLADRLGGLTDRRIYHLQFSRPLQLNHELVASLHRIMLDCMQKRSILVLQPDHVLSLKLLSVESQLIRGEGHQTAHLLMEIQRWLHAYSRDILDESDEVLDVRSQLVFTVGHQQRLEGSPDRWATTQLILGFVSQHAYTVWKFFPFGVEYEPGTPGSFPRLRILQADAGQELISRVVQDVLRHFLLNFTFGQLDSTLRDAIRRFISCEDPSLEVIQLVKEYAQNTSLWGNLLLLRGLLSNGILLFAFSKRRWRVDYGLSPARTTLAVPYRAKDIPAQRAEYGHPDVAIILTCLSYYYGGLSEEQLKLSFEILFTQHDPSLDYDSWVRTCPAVPELLRSFSSVNVESVEQWNNFLFPLFSRNRSTIDFYLARVVFPNKAKEFPSKLSSSGWDLAEKRERLLTGFSGTNDGQYLLPRHISQRDAEHQHGTNAKVLSRLLRPENNHYMCTAHKNGERRTTREFLQILVTQEPKIRVLLDVGAQMLDLKNHELARAWLDEELDASAAIYFNEDDELVVRTRNGSTAFLRSSPFAHQLDRCVVYLDDAHTRGTDIKFPIGFRAAVTLGPEVTKDRLAQGCMRMRMLGQGQSIMFFAPLEVDQSIRSVAGKDSSDPTNTSHILHWAIRETWEYIQRWAPQWVQQGIDHQSRYAAWSRFCSGHLTSKELSDKWVQPEAKHLEELFLPRNPSNVVSLNLNLDVQLRGLDLGVQSLSFVGLDEEQEREFVYEVQRERQVEMIPRAQPINHSVHPDVIHFVKTGVIPPIPSFGTQKGAFKPAFEVLDSTSAATSEVYIWSQSVLVTTDFEKTVETSGKMDDYLRPVHWILSAKRGSGSVLVILSPYEVNSLLPDIRSSSKVHLHLYTPRITKAIKSCDDLSLYSIPEVLDGWIPPSAFMDQLSVFAGQLYFKDHESYIRLCRFLSVYARDLWDGDGIPVEADAFIQPKNRQQSLRVQLPHTFESTPTAALRALIDIRSKGIDSASTHMGKLLRGQLLFESDFDNRREV